MAQYTIHLMGGVEVVGDGFRVHRFDTKRSVLLLARVALSRNRSMLRDEIAESLWPDDFLDATRGRLRQELARLRRALGAAEDIIEANRDSVWLKTDLVTTDVAEFESGMRIAASESDVGRRASIIERSVAALNGEFMPGYSEDWVLAERQRLQQAIVQTYIDLVATKTELGDLQAAVQAARDGLQFDPVSEAAHFALIKALDANHQSAEAIRQFQSLERILKAELGTQPSAPVQSFVSQIRNRETVSVSAPTPELGAPPEVPAAPAPVQPQVAVATAPEPKRVRVPVPLMRLYGRAAELAQLQVFLLPGQPHSVRLVTLTGPGGIGKTRLAIETAHILLPEYKGRVWYVAMGDFNDPAYIGSAILDELGDHMGTGRDPLDLIPEILGDEPALVVLDNLEHLVDGADQVLRRLLQACPHLRVLVTSRRTLDIPGEQEFPLRPLATPHVPGTLGEILAFPGVALFVDRAKQVRPDFEVTQETAQAIMSLVDKLDGIPLAIQLAAARIKVLTPRQMLDELEDRFSFLVSRSSELSERHRTLKETIGWSVQLIEDNLKEFLFQLSVFRGGCTYESARAVTQDKSTLKYLEQLRQRSLITEHESGTEMRFRMLESIREYSAEHLEKDQAEVVEERHARHFLQLAIEAEDEVVGANQQEWFFRLDAEHDNLRAALEWFIDREPESALLICYGTWRYWSTFGHQREGVAWCKKVLDRLKEPEPSRELAMMLFGLGVLQAGMSDEASIGTFERSREVFLALGDECGSALIDFNVAAIHCGLFNYKVAVEFSSRALSVYETHNRRLMQGFVKRDLGFQLHLIGDDETGIKYCRDGYAICSEFPDAWGRITATYALGMTLADAGHSEEGLSYLLRAHADYLAQGDIRGSADTGQAIAKTYLEIGDLEKSLEMLQVTVPKIKYMGDQIHLVQVLCIKSRCLAALGRQEESMARIEEALAVPALPNVDLAVALVSGSLADALSKLDRFEDAVPFAGFYVARCEQAGFQPYGLPRNFKDAFTDAVGSALGEKGFQKGWKIGTAWKNQDALTSALITAKTVPIAT